MKNWIQICVCANKKYEEDISAILLEKFPAGLFVNEQNDIYSICAYCPDNKEFELSFDKLEKNIAVELNNSSLKYKKNDTYLTQKMLDSAVKYNCPVAVGTDAHTANEVGVFEEALQMLSEIDFPISLVVNRTIADLKTFLKK